MQKFLKGLKVEDQDWVMVNLAIVLKRIFSDN